MTKVSINRRRHVLKAITWNLLAMTTTYLVLTLLPPFFGLQVISKEGAGFLTIVDRVIKFIFYYGHERLWFTSNYGVKKNS
tara:strand:- start:378 stop:620 length:243 start_codon:yes stop_codon:yes gene_type:complete